VLLFLPRQESRIYWVSSRSLCNTPAIKPLTSENELLFFGKEVAPSGVVMILKYGQVPSYSRREPRKEITGRISPPRRRDGESVHTLLLFARRRVAWLRRCPSERALADALTAAAGRDDGPADGPRRPGDLLLILFPGRSKSRLTRTTFSHATVDARRETKVIGIACLRLDYANGCLGLAWIMVMTKLKL